MKPFFLWRHDSRTARLALILVLTLCTLSLPALLPEGAAAIDVAWTRVDTPGPAADVATGPGGEPWIVLRDNRVFRMNGTAFEELPGRAATRIAVGRDGTPWVIGTDGNGYRRVNNRWERLFIMSQGADIAVGPDGAFYYTDTRGVTSRIEADGNSGNRVGESLAARLSVAPNGTIWIVQTDNKVVVPVNKAFRTMPGLAKDIGVGGNGAVWATGTDDSIWIFTGLGWERSTGVAGIVAAGPDGTPWVINAAGELYRGAAPTAAAPAAPPAPMPFAPAAVTTRPVIAFLCKLAGVTAEPRSREQVLAMLTGPGGFADYLREQSYGALSIEGTQVTGWLNLPQGAATYGTDAGYYTLASDCAAQARDLQFPENAILAFFTNGSINTGGVSYQPEIERGGVRRRYAATAYSEGGLIAPALVAHEVGHSLGMGHSLASWDPLGGAASGNTFLPDPVGPLGPGYNAYHRDLAGWIPAARKFRYAGTQQQITLTQLTGPTTADLLMAQIPIGAGPSFYTAELRTYTGADALGRLTGNIIPGEAVVIHRVEPRQIRDNESSNAFDTRVVAENNGAPDSEAAMWRTGKTFTDAANNVFIRVDEVDVLRGIARLTIGPVNAQAAQPTAPPAPQPTQAPPPPPQPTPVPPAAPPPPPAPAGNQPADNLAAAGLVTVPATVGPVSTAAATDEAGEPKPCGNIGKTLWLRFVATAGGQYTVSTLGSSFDTVVAVYRSAGPATGFASLTPIDCNDDTGGGRQSQLTFNATAGDTIYIQAGGYGGETGDLTVRVTAGTP